MGRLAVVGKEQTLGRPDPRTRVEALRPIGVFDRGDHIALYRHGVDVYVAAHHIDHAGHVRALRDLDCDRVLALSSVGSLRPELPVGTFVAPDDFIALHHEPVVAHPERPHVVPGFTPAWRARVVDAWRAHAADPVVDGGVYWQANGPRFETPAEVRMIATFADVVGMTVPSECVAANQLGLDYAAVCIVDNLANGLTGLELTLDGFERAAAGNEARLAAALARVVPAVAA